MRKTLEDLYYGNITPNTQDMVPNSELKRPADRVARFENQLTGQLDEAGQAVLAKLIESQHEIDDIIALEHFILGFHLGIRIMAESMDDNDGDIRNGGGQNMSKRRANGEGNLRKRSDGRWEGRYTAGYDSDTGKRIIKNVLGRTQAEAKEKLKAAVEQAQQVDVTRTDEYTVATWLKSWYELYAQPNVRQATADRYKLMIETYTIPRIGKIKLKKLTSRDLQKLYKDLMEHGRVNHQSGHGNPGLSSTTVRSVYLMLHSAFERAVKERLIPRNPTDDCIAPKVQKVEMKTLRPKHLKSYLDAADTRGALNRNLGTPGVHSTGGGRPTDPGA